MSITSSLLTSAFNNTLGAYIISAVITCILFGINLAQVANYFRRYSSDKAIVKCMVATVLCLEVFHAFLITHALYEDVIVRHGNPNSIATPTWSMALHSVSVALVDLIVRVFFSYRIWQLSEAIYIPAFIVLLSCCSLGIGIYDTVLVWSLSVWSDFSPAAWSLYTSFGIDICADTIITLYMVLHLRRKRNHIYATRSTSIILNSLMLYSISTGVVAVVFYATCLILYAVMPNNFIWQCIYAAAPQVFTNSMLVALNTREKLRSKGEVEHMGSGVRLEVHELVEIK